MHLEIAASVADVAAVNPNGVRTLLTNGLSALPTKSKRVFNNGPKNLTKKPSDCRILCN